MEQNDQRGHDACVIVELGTLAPGNLLTIKAMAEVFGKSPGTIMKAVEAGRLPRPFRTFSENQWRVEELDAFMQRRMQDAQRGSPNQKNHESRRPLKSGRSPIRRRPDARGA